MAEFAKVGIVALRLTKGELVRQFVVKLGNMVQGGR